MSLTRFSGLTKTVNVLNFGALGNGAVDDAPAIQAAITYAYNNNISGVYIPAGTYLLGTSLFLDAPNNLSSSLSTPTVFEFSLALIGDAGLGGTGIGGTGPGAFGTKLLPLANFPVLWVGPGQGMHVSGLQILGNGGVKQADNPLMIGIAIAGGSGGSSRTLIENCMIQNCYIGVSCGQNSDSLCDSVTIRKLFVLNCYIGWAINKTQNYINCAEECVFSQCTIGIQSVVGKPVTVLGGNYACTQGACNIFTGVTFSAMSGFADGPNPGAEFTATLPYVDQNVVKGVYDAYAIILPSYGIIPCQVQSYDAPTRVLSLQIYTSWHVQNYGRTYMTSVTDVSTELQANGTLYCCETVTAFKGCGFDVSGAHIENESALTRFTDAVTGWTGARASRFENCFFNYNIGHEDLQSIGVQKAIYVCQQVWPFIRAHDGDVLLDGCTFTQTLAGSFQSAPVMLDLHTYRRLIVNNCPDLVCPNMYCWFSSNDPAGIQLLTPLLGNLQSRLHMGGEWDATPWLPRAGTIDNYMRNGSASIGVTVNTYNQVVENGPGSHATPYIGCRPAPWATPRLSPTVLSNIMTGPGTLGSYPELCGETIYSVIDWSSGGLSHIWARSAHMLFTYGQNLSINWSYKGGSTTINLSNTSLMFVGLAIGLNNGSGLQNYMVTSVYPFENYITVARIQESDLNYYLVGSSGTTYSNTTIYQQPFAITQY